MIILNDHGWRYPSEPDALWSSNSVDGLLMTERAILQSYLLCHNYGPTLRHLFSGQFGEMSSRYRPLLRSLQRFSDKTRFEYSALNGDDDESQD